MNKRNLLVVCTLVVSMVAVMLMVSATTVRAQDYTPNWHNYQACLNDSGGNAINGTRDLYFAYYGQESGGSSVWSQYKDNVEIEDCYFTTKLGGDGNPLDYMDYEGNRYLEIRVCEDDSCDPSGTGAGWETLPRQNVGAVPYAYYAQYVQGYKYHVVVAKEYGDYDSVYDAVQSITDAGPNKPYLIWVAPGYYTETQTITTKPYVHIMGSGKYATYIYNNTTDKTFEVGSYASISDLTARNYYNGDSSYAFYVQSGAQNVYLDHVGAYADYQGNNSARHYAYYAAGQDTEVHIYYGYFYAYYGQYNYGIYNYDGATTYVKYGKYYGQYGQYAYGIYNEGTQSNTSYLDAYYLEARGQQASEENYGFYNYKNAEAKLNKGYYYGYYNGSGNECYGIYNQWATLYAHYVYAYGQDCSQYNYGLYNYYTTDPDYGSYRSVAELKYGYYYGYNGTEAYGIYNYGGDEGDHNTHNYYGKVETQYANAYAKGADSNYGLYNSNRGYAGLYYGYFGAYYYEGVGDYCYGMYNNASEGSTIKANYANGYAKNCIEENWGAYNRYGWLTLYGGTYYAYWDTSLNGSQPVCYGIGNTGKSGWVGYYMGTEVTAYAHNCYDNYGFANGDYGYANSYGGVSYAEGGNNAYGYYNWGGDGTSGQHWAQQCSGWATGASVNNYGYYNTNYAESWIDGCTLKGETYGIKVDDHSTTHAGLSKFDGGYKNEGPDTTWAGCYNNYDHNYTAVTCLPN